MASTHTRRRPDPRRRKDRGQAMLEFLILLPVLLLLFLATAEIAKLFAISGKSEVASRYLALRYFRGGDMELPGHDFQDALNPAAAAEGADELFFEGALGDSDDADLDVGYQEFATGEAGIFYYTPPPMDSAFWTVISTYFDPGHHIFPIRGHRVTYTYDLPFFPYKEMNAARVWGTDEGADPMGPYPLYTAKGDFVVLTDTFSGDTSEFLDMLAFTGLIISIPGGVVSAAIAIIVFLIFA